VSATVLEVRGARVRFGRVEALRGLDLELRSGEWVALLGPNGAGKSTLMRAVAGLVALDEGAIETAASGDVSGGALSRGLQGCRRPGFVPQEIALYDDLTTAENLDVFGRMVGLRRAALRERTSWALSWTGLEERRDSRVETLSGGMRRRLNIACGVLHSPALVLLDEPTVGVDPRGRDRIRAMLAGLRDQGTTLLQSTHQFAEVESVCDRVVIIDAGRVVAEGTPTELSERVHGGPRAFRMQLDRSVDPSVAHDGCRVDGAAIVGHLHDVERELTALMSRVGASGARVRDLHLESPGLEAVFAALTGRELRE